MGFDIPSPGAQTLPTMLETISTLAGVDMLLQRKLDCYANDELSILWTLSNYPKSQRTNVEPVLQLSSEFGYLAYANARDKYPYLEAFRQALDDTIRNLHRQGKIKAIQVRFAQQMTR